VLRQQVLILQRQQAGRRAALTRTERPALVLACAGMARRRLLDALMIVRPDTLVRWHRQIVRRHWRLMSRRQAGRPPVDPEAERLVLRLAKENPGWGYTKIAGEMRKLGFRRLGRTTVGRILRRNGLVPSPCRGRGLTWAEFLGHYQRFIWACDFFTVTTAALRTYYVLLVLEIGTRRIRFWNVSESPDGAWVAQQFRNLSVVSDQMPEYLIRDRDEKFTMRTDALLQAADTQIIRVPARSPDLNGHIERCIRTLREECLDRIIILNEDHLRWMLAEFVLYHNERRPHRSLGLRTPAGPRDYPREGEIARRQVLGGVVNDYYRKAA
jgi:putative transposase